MTILTEVWTDGLGTYQARCPTCAWRGRWHRLETTAIVEARVHGADHAQSDEAIDIRILPEGPAK